MLGFYVQAGVVGPEKIRVKASFVKFHEPKK